MDHDSTSFWRDIKKYEDTLAKDPESYCFAPLAEIYRKIGLLDEAITVSRKGVALHPDYLGGLLALGRASFDKGLCDESRMVLQKVVAVSPDNLLALRLLEQLDQIPCDVAGVPDQLPDTPWITQESSPVDYRLSAVGTSGTAGPGAGELQFTFIEDDETILEEAEVVEDDQYCEGLYAASGDQCLNQSDGNAAYAHDADVEAQQESIATVTLAEIYVAQGFIDAALAMYRELLADDPNNFSARQRYEQLLRQQTSEQSDDENPPCSLQADAQEHNDMDAHVAPICSGAFPSEQTALTEQSHVVLEQLEAWLDRIKRRQACRCGQN